MMEFFQIISLSDFIIYIFLLYISFVDVLLNKTSKSIVVVAFQSAFNSKIHQNNIFLKKIYF
jgi:hypothetical protein